MIRSFLLSFLLFITISGHAQTDPCESINDYTIVVLGSSTAAGSGTSHPDSSWVNRYRAHLQSLNPSSNVINLALGGYSTYQLMPSNFTPPPARPLPDTLRNITTAIDLNPDAIIVNLPSNDVASGFSYAEQMANFDSIANMAASNNIPLWLCTTQPRNFADSMRQLQFDIKDSIFALYSPFAIDFWSTIALPDHSIDSTYDSGDGIHLNDLGHSLLFQRVIDANLLSVLYTPPSTPDYTIMDIFDQTASICGDSSTILGVIVGNIGSTATSAAQVHLNTHHLPSGGIQSDLIDITSPLVSCESDTFFFSINTFQSGNYELTGIISFPSDTFPANDTININFSRSGHPQILGVNDTLCSPGQAVVSSIHAIGDSVFWYQSINDSVPIHSGTSFTTPLINSTNSWYAEAVRGDLHFTSSLFSTGNSNIEWNGTMFDLIAQEPLVIDSFEVKMMTPGTQAVEVYYKSGSHLGYELNSNAWTLVGTADVQVNNAGDFVVVPVGNISIPTGDTNGVYIQFTNPAAELAYQWLANPQTRSNSELTMISGSGISHNFSGNYYPRDWNGRVFYHFGERPDGDCKTDRIPITAHVSETDFSLGNDTILDILDTLILSGPSGMIDYLWFDNQTTSTNEIIANSLGNGIHFASLTVTDSLLCSFSDSIIIAVADLVGLEELSSNLGVFPNPATTVLHISDQDIKVVELLSEGGEHLNFYPIQNGMIRVDHLSDGIYFLRTSNEANVRVTKFLKTSL